MLQRQKEGSSILLRGVKPRGERRGVLCAVPHTWGEQVSDVRPIQELRGRGIFQCTKADYHLLVVAVVTVQAQTKTTLQWHFENGS